VKATDRTERNSRTAAHGSSAPGVQDASGVGLFGLTLGILAGFLASFYWIVPFFPKVKAMGNLTVMTAVVVVAMASGGALGYLASRRA